MIVADAEREHWKRKAPPPMDPAKDAIVFQQLDIDHVVAEPHSMLGPKRKAMGPAAMLRIFGVTAGGNSVCVHVHGFEPYFYAKVPDSFQQTYCEQFRKNLNETVSQQQRGGGVTEAQCSSPT
jgi:DNA polymerase delta subunit 1